MHRSIAHAQFLHPKINGKQTTIRKVVILPAKVDVVRSGMKGPEGMAAESEELSARVEKAVAEVLFSKKFIATASRACDRRRSVEIRRRRHADKIRRPAAKGDQEAAT